ncbi:MAG: hypothetical protein ACRD2A_22605, partial [Vicinamibacterales bacterium]
DLNGATGAVAFGGIEFIIEVEGPAFRLYRWNGSDIEQVASPSLRADFIAGVKSLRIEIHPNDVGGTRGFNFWILTVTGEANDIAPDGASLWTYSLSPGPLVLSVERFTTSPSRARAGRTFTAAMVAGREDLNEILEEGTITCTLKIGKRTIRATLRRFVDATATCRWRVPMAAKGQRYSGSVAVAFGGKTVRRAFSGKVR